MSLEAQSNTAPSVSIISPTNGAMFTVPGNIFMFLDGRDPDGPISAATVEIFANGDSLGLAHLSDPGPPHESAFQFTWANPMPRSYALTARITDNLGANSTSAPVNIVVVGNPLYTFVKVEAEDPQAAEPETTLPYFDAGLFRFTRVGNTNVALPVYFSLSGTASNGVDYSAISNVIVIPAGITIAHIVVNPLVDHLPEGVETVTLRLQSPVCVAIYPPPPDCYVVGSPDQATVYIYDQPFLPIISISATDPIAAEGTNWLSWPGCSNSASGPFGTTNTATFVVRRTDHTNWVNRVFYEVSGTASNGVDYAFLRGDVTIPPGKYTAEIRIVPLDDAIPEHIETVIIRLRPPPVMDSVLPYLVGYPDKAAAILVDNDGPCPATCVLPEHCFHINWPAAPGTAWRIECSTNLVQWTPVCTNSTADGGLHFIDLDVGEVPGRFYRAVREDMALGE